MSSPHQLHPPADLIDLQLLFDSWRHSRKKRSSIPDHLRDAARSLLARYSMAAICRATRLHPRSLKQRLTPSVPHTVATIAASAPDSAYSSAEEPEPAPFFHLPPPPPQQPPLANDLPSRSTSIFRLQFERPDGCRLILELPSSQRSQVDSLCAAFLRHP